MIVRMIIQIVASHIVFGALLFLPAGTMKWLGAWVFLGEMLVLTVAAGLWLARRDPALLIERLRSPVQRSQIPADKVFMGALVVLFPSWFIFMALDAVRFHWSHMPLWSTAFGALSLGLAVWIGCLTFRENSFAAQVVKVQQGQTVATAGPYRYVRHPMYAGGIFYFIGVPSILGSCWGFAGSILLTAAIVGRILAEERALAGALPEYEEYAKRVRYHLIPLVW